EIANVFLTHLHDDHTSDLAALLSHQWTTGRIEPTTVHGPHGTRALVEAAVAFGAANAAIRLVDEAEVGLLVLSHLVPGALSDLPDEAYIEGVRKTFSGRVVVGRDFMEL